MDFDFKETIGCGLESMIGECTHDCQDILKKLLAYEPHKRISAGEALRHEYFHEILEKEMEREFEKSQRYTSISNLNLINYYDSRQSTYRYDEGVNNKNQKDHSHALGQGKHRAGANERSRTYSKPIKYKQSQGSEVDESFEYRKTIKLPNIERGGSFEYNSTRNSIKKKFIGKNTKFAFAVKSPKKPFGKAKNTIKYVLEGKRIGGGAV